MRLIACRSTRHINRGMATKGGILGRSRRHTAAYAAHTVRPYERQSPVIVGQRDQAQRIRDAITDLQVVIDGCAGQPEHRLVEKAASLARHCSIFLRKMALNDSHNRHLLDEDFCRTAGLRFDRIRRISGDRRTLSLVPVNSSGGFMQATKLNEETRQPETVYRIPIGPQRLSFDVQWPLPGMADWRSQPTRR